jgi:hypothetical protein
MKVVELQEQIIKVHVDEARRLSSLPTEVDIVRVFGEDVHHHPDSVYFYLHVRSACAFIRPYGAALCIEPLAEFLERYVRISEQRIQHIRDQQAIP